MPPPNRRDRLDPEDLARKIAERLAESGESTERAAFSWRDSVLVGRLISGLIIVVVAGVLVFGVTMGVNWFMGRSTAAVGDVEPIYPDGGGGTVEAAPTETTIAARVEGLSFLASTTTTTLAGPFAPTTIAVGISRVTLPPTTTTTIFSTPTTSQSTTSSSAVVPTTQPPGTTIPTSPPTTGGPTTSTTTPQVTTTTTPSTSTTQSTTTTTQPSTTTSTTASTSTTTTTQPTTTTTQPTTTTTASATTTTTCGNNGNGNGNC